MAWLSGKPYWAKEVMPRTICSAASGAMPFCAIPSYSAWVSAAIFASLRLDPMARRSASACPPEKPAAIMATRMSCSWKSGTPSVRSSTGSSAGCG